MVLDAADEIVYVAHVTASRTMSVAVGVGIRDPAVTTSLGRVPCAGEPDEWLKDYLASLELAALSNPERTITSRTALAKESRRSESKGWSMVDQELEEGVCALAAPIHDAAGDVIDRWNVAVKREPLDPEEMREQPLPDLLEIATQIDRDARALPHRLTPGRASPSSAAGRSESAGRSSSLVRGGTSSCSSRMRAVGWGPR